MGIKEIRVGSCDVHKVPVDKLVEEPGFNLRQEGPELDAYIRALADYIKNKGVPGVLKIKVRDDTVYVRDGHCRRRAALIAISEGANIKWVPCVMQEKYSNEVDEIAGLITSNSGKPLTPLEKASVVKRLKNLNQDNTEIAQATGMTPAYVGQLLELYAAPHEVREMVKAGEVSATTAMKEMKENPVEASARLKKAVVKAKGEGKKRATEKHLDAKPHRPPKRIPLFPKVNLEKLKDTIGALGKDDFMIIHSYVVSTYKAKYQ